MTDKRQGTISAARASAPLGSESDASDERAPDADRDPSAVRQEASSSGLSPGWTAPEDSPPLQRSLDPSPQITRPDGLDPSCTDLKGKWTDSNQSQDHSGNPGLNDPSQAATEPPSFRTPGGKSEREGDVLFACCICLCTAEDAVVTHCGHLYCWPCLWSWFEACRERRGGGASGGGGETCPACKAPSGTDQVVPIFGAGSQGKDPRTKPLPPRPKPVPLTSRAGEGTSSSWTGSRVSFQAGIFPLPGLSFTWSSSGLGTSTATASPFTMDGLTGPGQFDRARLGHDNNGAPVNEAEFLGQMMQKVITVLFFAFFLAMAFS